MWKCANLLQGNKRMKRKTQDKNASDQISFEVPAADFVLKHIFECGQCFRWEREENNNNFESYFGIAGGRVARVSVTDAEKESTGTWKNSETCGRSDEKKVTLRIDQFSRPEKDSESNGKNDILFWKNYFDLDTDYGKIKMELSKDRIIKQAIPFGHGIRILRQDPWETTVSFIISQNNNIPRIKKNIRDLAKLAGKPVNGIFPSDLRWYELPSPEELAHLTVDDLAPVRLGYRARYLIETARCVCEQGLDVLTDDLDSLCGVGPKVASCIRLFGLNQTDSFPIDVWVRRVMRELYDIEKPAEMKAFAEKTFGRYGGIAQQYLFYYMREK